LNGFNLVIMREDNGVSFFLKAQNIGSEVDTFEGGGHGEMEWRGGEGRRGGRKVER
jgi:hypothetical protein